MPDHGFIPPRPHEPQWLKPGVVDWGDGCTPCLENVCDCFSPTKIICMCMYTYVYAFTGTCTYQLPFKKFYWSIVDAMLVSIVQQSDSVMHIYILFISFSIIVITLTYINFIYKSDVMNINKIDPIPGIEKERYRIWYL